MTSETGCMKLRRRTTLGRGINPRGARHWGAASRHQTCMRQVRLDPDHDAVMRIGGIAPGGGPILSVGIGATSASGKLTNLWRIISLPARRSLLASTTGTAGRRSEMAGTGC